MKYQIPHDQKQIQAKLVTDRSARYSAELLTTEGIQNNYSGRDTQKKIRNAIKNYVTGKQTEYVVPGGDDTIIPDSPCNDHYYVEAGGS